MLTTRRKTVERNVLRGDTHRIYVNYSISINISAYAFSMRINNAAGVELATLNHSAGIAVSGQRAEIILSAALTATMADSRYTADIKIVRGDATVYHLPYVIIFKMEDPETP